MAGRQSFWPGGDLLKDWRKTAWQAQAFIEQVQRSLAYYAWVETSVQGESLGRTSVHWLGDVTTEWRAGLDAEQVGLHQHAVVGFPGEMEKFWALGHSLFTTQRLVKALTKRPDTVGEPRRAGNFTFHRI
jgi:hypothetical protein